MPKVIKVPEGTKGMLRYDKNGIPSQYLWIEPHGWVSYYSYLADQKGIRPMTGPDYVEGEDDA